MKRIHFDVEEDGFYGTYWACKDAHTAAGTDRLNLLGNKRLCELGRGDASHVVRSLAG